MSHSLLIRYGLIPEVARFPVAGEESYARGECVVVRSHRGVEIGTVLERVKEPEPASALHRHNGSAGEPERSAGEEATEKRASANAGDTATAVLRRATSEDATAARRNEAACRDAFEEWRQRIENWRLELELIDLEWTLNREKLILYVLNDRGADCTKLALYAAASGYGTVLVQPVNAEGLVRIETPVGNCGAGGCGSCGNG